MYWGLLALLILLLAACGPESGTAEDNPVVDNEEIALRIATAYGETGDVNRARIDLQDINVANPAHWLRFLTERYITEDQSPGETQALVQLTIGLGLQTAVITQYAQEHNLLASAPQPTFEVTQPSQDNVIALEPAPRDREPVDSSASSVEGETATDTSTETLTETESSDEIALETEPELDPAPIAEPEPASPANPMAQATDALNVRGGPGTNYAVVGALNAGSQVDIVARNPQSDWWQVTLAGGQQGWVYGPLVNTSGDTGAIGVAANIPAPPPPTPVPEPVAAAPPAAEEAPPAAEPPQEEVPAEEEAPPEEAAPEEAAPEEEAPAEEPPPPSDVPYFTMTERRLWDVYENGGRLDGPSVICGEKHELIVNVIDANGSRLNGITVDGLGSESYVTGAQGKGDGVVEFVLWSGQEVRVGRDNDGREAQSDLAAGLTTNPGGISFEDLIAGQYCADEESCNQFANPSNQAPGCLGHFSWTVTFQRNY